MCSCNNGVYGTGCNNSYAGVYGCGCNGRWPGSCGWNCGCNNRCGTTNWHTISGTVIGTNGAPVANMPVEYTINGYTYTTNTNASGYYAITVPAGAAVTVTPQVGLGVTVTPSSYSYPRVCSDMTGQNFNLSPVVPTVYTVSGVVTGLAAPAGQTVSYNINGVMASTVTDSNGAFAISGVGQGSTLVINAPVVSGYTIMPPSITLSSISGNISGLTFIATQIVT